MVTQSLGLILDGAWKLPQARIVRECRMIYIIRNDSAVLYVGMSQSPIARIWQHVGYAASRGGVSRIGQVVLQSLPAARDWLVDFPSFADSAPFIDIWMPELRTAYDNLIDRDPVGAARWAEEALIFRYNPRYNVVHN